MIDTAEALDPERPERPATSVSPQDPEYLRLVSGSGPHEGRVEVYHDGQWGSVCDDGWDDQDSQVVCCSLGMTGGEAVMGLDICRSVEVIGGGIFGSGCGPIWLDGVKCLGSEENLKDCLTDSWGEHNCNHGGDAGVRCGKNRRCNISVISSKFYRHFFSWI